MLGPHYHLHGVFVQLKSRKRFSSRKRTLNSRQISDSSPNKSTYNVNSSSSNASQMKKNSTLTAGQKMPSRMFCHQNMLIWTKIM